MLLGLWTALIPFVGPYFNYAFGGYGTWQYSTQRLWLDILPGAAAILGGLLLLSSARRLSGLFAGSLALAGGAWLAIGPSLSLLWHPAGDPIGIPMGGHVRQAFELFGYFYAPAVLILALAAFAMGRFMSRPHLAVEDAMVGGAAGDRMVGGAVGDRMVGGAVGDRGTRPGAATRSGATVSDTTATSPRQRVRFIPRRRRQTP